MLKTVLLDTKCGKVEILIEPAKSGMVQLNAPMPPVGPGIFLLVMEEDRQKGLDALKALVEGEQLPENTNITDKVEVAIVAGTVARPAICFGVPAVWRSDNIADHSANQSGDKDD